MDKLPALLSLLSILAAIPLLILLTLIDLKHFLLPNRYVFPLGILGVFFHTVSGFPLFPPAQMVGGILIGAGLLYIVRAIGTFYYKQEAMGLGDIKLMGAAGAWLGGEHIITAIMLGALFGLIHGLIVAALHKIKKGEPFSIRRLVIPAGPGFIAGIVTVFIFEFGPFILQMTSEILS